ncbi:PD-(D/E)XK nuclease family protein [Microbacterium lacticum]
MASKSDIFMLRGIVAHRAVLWPFTRPCTGTWLDNYRRRHAIQSEADITMDVLEAAIRAAWDTGHTAQYRAAEALLNLNGPSDEKAAFEGVSRSLTPNDRDAVLAGLRDTVRNAAGALEQWIRTRGPRGDEFTCLWAEAPLLAVDGYFTHPDALERNAQVDLVGFRAGGDIEIIDLKFGNHAPPDWVIIRDRDQIHRYLDTARAHLTDPDRHITGRLLYIGRGTPTAHWTPWQTLTT